jgi:microcystin-dependent protein
MDHNHPRAMPGSVDSAAIVDGSIVAADLADGAVTSAKILDGTIALADLSAALVALLVPTGTIAGFGGTAAPTGWVLCDGAAISRSTFAALFAVISTTYGVGDGSTTFNVPDLRQRFPLGKATSGTGSTLGGTGGAIDHVHALDSATSHAKVAVYDNIDQIASEQVATANWTRNAGASLAINGTGATDNVGAKLGGSSNTANAPFQAINFIVKT